MRGVVVAPQPLAAEVGQDILRRGGNAFDAAVAAAFTQTVTDPLMCGITGMGIANVLVAATGEQQTVSFFARFGSRARPDVWLDRVREGYVEGHPDQIGYASIMVPGTVAGLGEIHRRWGSLPWADLVRPAAEIARRGIPLYPYIEDYFRYPSRPAGPTQLERFTASPEMARLWMQDGAFRRMGETIANPEMAASLDAIAANGAEEFYTGALGRQIAADLEAHGSLITAEDLAQYRPRVQPPLAGSYRGYTVTTTQPPGGGVTLLQLLALLEHFDPGALEHGSADHLDLLIRALKQAFADRNAYVGDPEFVPVAVDRLLSKGNIDAMLKRMGGPAPAAGPASSPGTTHLSVSDAAGNVVSVTHTLATGSGVVTPGLGFQYNNAADHCEPVPGKPNSIAPGKARLSAMCPTILYKDGLPVMALGSPGSNAIIGAVAQVIANVVDFGMTPVEAVSASRLHCEGGPVLLESRTPPAVVRELERRGHRVNVRPYAYDMLQGRVQLIRFTEGDVVGASDPRRDGGVALYA